MSSDNNQMLKADEAEANTNNNSMNVDDTNGRIKNCGSTENGASDRAAMTDQNSVPGAPTTTVNENLSNTDGSNDHNAAHSQQQSPTIGESSESYDENAIKRPLNYESEVAASETSNENYPNRLDPKSSAISTSLPNSGFVDHATKDIRDQNHVERSNNDNSHSIDKEEQRVAQSSIDTGADPTIVNKKPIPLSSIKETKLEQSQNLMGTNDNASGDVENNQSTNEHSTSDPITSIQPDHASSLSKVNDKEAVHPDRKKAALLLSHRKMILQRLKQCKTAAEQRLIEYQRNDKIRNENGDNETTKSKQMTPSEGKASISTAPKLPLKSNHVHNEATNRQRHLYDRKIYMSRKEEIDEFKELSSFALSFNNRRQPSTASTGNNLAGAVGGSTRNISLRTGSSVGNKMKAAVKTLTNNSGWASSSSPSVDSSKNVAAIDGTQKSNSSKKNQSQNQGKRGVLPQHAKYNGAQNQLNTPHTQNLNGGNIVVGKSTSNATIIQNNHGKNGIQIASMPTSSLSKKSQQSKKVGNTIAQNNNYPISSMKNQNESLRPSVTMANNMTIVNGPGHIHQAQQVVHATGQTIPGKKLKKQGKGRRSTSKRSISAASTTPTNENVGQPQLQQSGIVGGQKASQNNTGVGVGTSYWSNKDSSSVSGHYPHQYPAQGLHSTMINTAHFKNANNQVVIPQQLPPRILCPETERLRRKRKNIETKLESLFKKRYLRSAMNQIRNERSFSGNEKFKKDLSASKSRANGVLVSSPKSSTFDLSNINSRTFNKSNVEESYEEKFSSAQPCENQYMRQIKHPQQKSKPISWKALMSMGGQSACLLPQRRKTQWDFVLEEMRWLASDFIEERKWKRASSSTIAHAIMSQPSLVSSYSSPSRVSQSSSRIKSTMYTGSSRSSSNMSSIDTPSKMRLSAETNFNEEMIEIKRASSENREGVSNKSVEDPDDDCPREMEYNHPLDEDLKTARSNAKTMANIIEYKWKVLTSNINSRSLTKTIQMKGDDWRLDETTSHDAQNLHKIEKKRQCSYEEIIAAMEDSLSYALKLKSDLPSTYEKYERSCSKDLEKINLELHVSQIKCLQYAEALWNTTARTKVSGFILDGPIASGKTFSVCALLWRRRELGPQILICSSLSLTRWSHELKRFSGLNVINFQDYGTSQRSRAVNRISMESNNCDVIVCDASATKWFCRSTFASKIHFSTLVVDLRCMSASSARFDENNVVDLSSCTWWSDCINKIVKTKTKTILVNSTRTMDRHEPQRIFETLQTPKDVEMLSMKLAFIQHHLFHSDSGVYAKRVFRWAKKQHFDLKNKTVLEGSSRLFNMCFGGKGVLSRATEIFTYIHEEVDEDLPSVFPNWFVQFCPLTPLQREGYERNCNFLRGSLTCRNDKQHQDENGTFAKSLLRLRRHCFISNLSQSFESGGEKFNDSTVDLNHILTMTKDRWSSRLCSQPNIDIAKTLLDNSSKLQQLFNILCKDCGFEVFDSNDLLTIPLKGGKRRKKRKKVVILSCLPDILQVTSTFLDAVGMSHELILPPLGHNDKATTDEHKSLFDSLCWRFSQEAIVRFEQGSDTGVSTDILLGSPEILGSMSLGLSAANAEVVISLDEDWSGRSNLQIFSILMKNCIQADSGGGRKYIKLIAEDSCEESFLTFTKRTKGRSSVYPIPLLMSSIREALVDNKGFLASKVNIEEKESVFCSNILRCSNVPLSTILCTSNVLPPLSESGSVHRFLDGITTRSNDSSDTYSEKFDADLVSLGSNIPSLVDDSEKKIDLIESNDARIAAISVISSLIDVESDFTSNAWTKAITMKPFETLDANAFKIFFEELGCRSEAEFYIQDFFDNAEDFHGQKREQVKLSNLNKASRSKSSRKKNSKKVNGTQTKSLYSSKSKKTSSIDTNKALSSLLVYALADEQTKIENVVSRQKKRDRGMEEVDVQPKQKRQNLFAMSYTSSNFKQDGNQGIESSVYYPPLFPTPSKQINIESVEEVSSLLESFSKKRKVASKGDHPGKKIRSSKSLLSPGKSGSLVNVPLSHEPVFSTSDQKDIASDLNLITSTDADFMANTSSLFDDEFLPDLSLEKVPDIIEDKEPENIDPVVMKPDLNEDFGLLGSGTLLSMPDSLASMMKFALCGNPYSYWLDPFEPQTSLVKAFSFHCDTEEASNHWRYFLGPQLDSVILKVKLNRRSLYSNVKGISSGFSGMPSSFVPQMNFNTSIKPMLPMNPDYLPTEAKRNNQIVHQITQNKKKKKSNDKRCSSSPTISYSQPTHQDSAVRAKSFGMKPPSASMKQTGLPISNVMMKDRDHKKIFTPYLGRPYVFLSEDLTNKVISSLRTESLKSELFRTMQSPSSLVHVKSVSPSGNVKSIDTTTEDESIKALLMNQSNFAPFSSGFIPEDESEKSDLFVSSYTGINLPMGVKVPRRHKGFSVLLSNNDSWIERDGRRLDECVQRFGRNWHLASQILSCSSFDSNVKLSGVRSARQCNEKWDLSMKQSKRVSSDVFSGEADPMQENNKINVAQDEDSSGSSQLSSIVMRNELKVGFKTASQKPPMKDQLGRLKTARLKRQIVPLTVPGGGSNTAIQTHSSHLQSVQNAVNMASSTSGLPPAKLEMWPLQFLDVAEKQRQNIAKRNGSEGQSHQQSVLGTSHPSQHMHGIRQPIAPPTHQNPIVQQRSIGHSSVRNAAITSPHASVPRSQEAMQPLAPSTAQHPSSSGYVHPMHPTTNRMGTNRR